MTSIATEPPTPANLHHATVPLSALYSVLSRTLKLRGAAAEVPLLQGILLEVKDGALFATATDRFVVGVARAALSDEHEASQDFRVVIPGEVVKVLTADLKRDQRKMPLVPVTITDDGRDVIVSWIGMTRQSLKSYGDFPAIDRVLRNTLQQSNASASTFRLDPKKFAQFADSVEKKGSLTVLVPETSHKAVGLIGTDFIGAIMPLRGAPTEPEGFAHILGS